jgi:hypothetical protein
MLLRRAQICLAVLAAMIAVAVGLGAGVSSVPAAGRLEPVLAGVLAGTATLAICSTLLAVAGAVWRSRLAARDGDGWADEWARVGPRWRRSTD